MVAMTDTVGPGVNDEGAVKPSPESGSDAELTPSEPLEVTADDVRDPGNTGDSDEHHRDQTSP